MMLDALVDLSWRAYPGGVMLAVGIAAVAYGLIISGRVVAARVSDGSQPIALVSGLRVALVGAAVAGLAGAWIWQQVWLLVLALVFGAEELLETSVVLYVLRRGRRLEASLAEGRR